MYLYLKALHIISVVAWFAALFYLPRLFVYHTECAEQNKIGSEQIQAQLTLMMRRLWYIIALPAATLTLIFGVLLFVQQARIAEWLIVKLIFVAGLYSYHWYLGFLLKKISVQKKTLSACQYRWLNEVPTLFLVAIVFLVVSKEVIGSLKAVGIFLCTILILFLAVKIYKKRRNAHR